MKNIWFPILWLAGIAICYVVPVFIYRFSIRKKAIEDKPAKIITFLYSLAWFFLIGVLSKWQALFEFFIIFFFAFLNYIILAYSKKNFFMQLSVFDLLSFLIAGVSMRLFVPGFYYIFGVNSGSRGVLLILFIILFLIYFHFRKRIKDFAIYNSKRKNDADK